MIMVNALRLCPRESLRPATHTNLRVEVFLQENDGNPFRTFTLRRLLTKISVYETSMHNFVRVTTIKQTRIHISRERHGILVIPAS